MSETNATPNKRRAASDADAAAASASDIAGARKRRAFLQTMGQQLREFGVDGTSPQDHNRTTFGTSPASNARPASHSTNLAAPNHNVDTPESDAAPGEDDQLPAGAAKSASKWLWSANEVLPVASSGRVPSLNFEDLLDWSQSYFDHWHPAFPYLHAPSLIDYMRHVSHNGLQLVSSSNMFHHIIIRTIMSISVADRRQTSAANASNKALPSFLVFHSFNDAISSVQLVLTEESSILSLQALVSVQLFLITMHRYNAASRLEGLAVRMAFQLGLHRCPHKASPAPDAEAGLRKRLFWSVYCIDRYICIRLGTPLGVRSDEMNVCFPHGERHDPREVEVSEQDDRLSFLEFLARHASIRGTIMETRTKSALRDDYNDTDQVMEVEAEHTKWWNTVDEYLSNDNGKENIIKAHQVTLLVLRFESVLALHRSVLATSKKNSTYNAALQRCISASRSIINTLHKALKGFGAFDGSPGSNGYESTPLLWPSFTWAVWMSVFIIVFAATEGQLARQVALRLSDRSIEILQHLGLRGTSWPEACIVAVQNLTARLREGNSRGATAGPGPGHGASADVSSSSASSAVAARIGAPMRLHTRGLEYQTSGRSTPRGQSVMPPGMLQSMSNNATMVAQSTASANALNTFNMSANNWHNSDMMPQVGAYLGGAGNFLGIAQQSSDNPLPNDEIMHLFNGEDMGFWFGENTGYGGFNLADGHYH
ncbi:fungal-specific transcription factor domain-containing protein [Paraphoma chrysanthemicola]|nr:fungal-specific transcription factor domain-containing protein [Paraphoma chrysanthemicola]